MAEASEMPQSQPDDLEIQSRELDGQPFPVPENFGQDTITLIVAGGERYLSSPLAIPWAVDLEEGL